MLEVEGAFADGVAFADLTPLTAPDNLDAAVAAALGFALDPNPQRSPRTQVLDYLREKRLLLVLDNCEQLREAVGELASAVLAETSGVLLLATSRERLGLRAEQISILDGLQIVSDGAALFVATARTVQPRLALDTASTPLVAQICARLGGMPLAIELAAGWADTLGLEAIAAEVGQSDGLLVATTEDTPERHRSVWHVFAATWARLPPAEQAAFAQIAVFRGGATRPALQAVTGADLITFKALVGKALLRYDPERDRYSVHELLRQYAAERLAEDPAAERATRTRHAAYYLAALGEREQRLKGPEQQAALNEIGKDLENVRAAWDWALQQSQWHLLTPAAVIALGYSLQWRADYDDGLVRFTAAADALAVSNDFPPLLPALLWGWQGAFAVLLGRRAEAATILTRAWALLPAETDDTASRLTRGFILLQRGLSARHDGMEQAEGLLAESITAYGAPEARWERGTAMVALGELFHKQGRCADAERHLDAALTLYEACGDQRGMAYVLQYWSQTAVEMGRLDAAEHLILRALTIYQELDDLLSNAIGWGRLGVIQQWIGAPAESVESLRRSLAHYHQLGEPFSIAYANVRLALSLCLVGSYSEASAEAEAGLTVFRRSGPSEQLAFALWVTGAAAGDSGDWKNAEAYHRESIAIYRATSAFGQLGWPISSLAHLALVRDDIATARKHILEVLAPTDNRFGYLSAVYGVAVAARIMERSGRPERALELYKIGLGTPTLTETMTYRQTYALWHAALRAALPAEVVAAAEERGRQLDFWATVESLRRELAELVDEPQI